MNERTVVIDPTRELPAEVHEHLERRYGAGAGEVVAIAAADARLARPIVVGLPDLLAEAVFAARHEQAGSVADFLLRRTRVGVRSGRETCEAAGAVARRVAIAMAPELGWSSERTFREAEAWALEVSPRLTT
jgi:glycerol-3-phosphate dehydrogenase